jgi:anti-sigma factor RsiW
VSCDDVRIDLGAYVLGALEPDERRRVDEHLRDCPACAAE